ncbi:MAG: molecular chaperone HtpG [Gammaproteobacteria bacterium]|nr:molecular chaperone HtpG [Gammaproteobacteria bacterium]
MTVTAHKETHGFQTEVKQLLHLMIHSLYSNKEIFLRELISNASDAADKLRFKALENGDLYEGDGSLKVWVKADKEQRTLTIRDNGIGMTRDEVIENLGTIARSGTAEFVKALGSDQSRDSNLIGQFGVGFYSAFIVADRVTVRTRAAGESADRGVEWESAGEGNFTVADLERADRGTEIVLHLREGEDELLDSWKLRSIITKYSDHISIPVELWQEPFSAGEDDAEQKEGSFEQVNRATALWTRSKSDISDDEYREFYKHISHDFEDPLAWSHQRVEGKHDYTALLYIPGHAPWDMYNRDAKHGLKLYVQRVFIMDDAEQFMPTYLRFVKGVLDSNDLPLNVSREILQDNQITDAMRKACTKRVLDQLAKLAEDDADKYQKFWGEFGTVLKEGPAEDFANREKVASLLRFASTAGEGNLQTVGLDSYIERMKEGQEAIYFITADSHAAAANSPHLEIFKKKGVEVLLLSERIDEWLMSHLSTYKDKPLRSVTRGALDLGKLADEEEKKAQEEQEKAAGPVVERLKKALGDKVKDVRATSRLTDSPACIVTDEHDPSSQMVKLMKAVGQKAPEVKYILEINAGHPLVTRLEQLGDDSQLGDWAELLLDQACLAEQGGLEDPSAFVSRVNRLLLQGLS